MKPDTRAFMVAQLGCGLLYGRASAKLGHATDHMKPAAGYVGIRETIR